MVKPLVVVAVSGDTLIQGKQRNSIPDQYVVVVESVQHIVDIVEAEWDLALTHGSGPQMDFVLRRSELASNEVSPVPLDYAAGDTQGAIGYAFQRTLHNGLTRRGINKPVIALVTQTRVSPHDDASTSPSKLISTFLNGAAAQQRRQQLGWTLTEDTGCDWRRTVPFLASLEVIEHGTITHLVCQGYLVIACDGDGIPVVRDGRRLKGVKAVVDKDLASALLANQLGTDLLVIPISVEEVMISFGTSRQQWFDAISVARAQTLLREGRFGVDSMRPKMETIVGFINASQ